MSVHQFHLFLQVINNVSLETKACLTTLGHGGARKEKEPHCF